MSRWLRLALWILVALPMILPFPQQVRAAAQARAGTPAPGQLWDAGARITVSSAIAVGGPPGKSVQEAISRAESPRVRLSLIGSLSHAGRIRAALRNAPDSQAGKEVGVCTWLGCKSGALSYSEDDGLTLCRAPLEAAGFRGTFYQSGTSTLAWFADYSAAGHEVGSHLADHTLNCVTPPSCFPNCTSQTLWQTPYTQEDVTNFRRNQIEPNITAIEAGTGKPVVSMSYPCGGTDAGRMMASTYYFVAARGYYDPWDSNLPWVYDVNRPTPVEFMNLNADTAFSSNLVDRAISEGAWDIVTMHDVCMGIEYISSRRDNLWVAPVGEVIKYIRVRNAATFSSYIRSDQTISFDAVHNLENLQRQKVDGTRMTPIVYDNPVTLQVYILDTDQVGGVQVNGAPVSYMVHPMDGSRYVIFDTSLDSTKHITVSLSNGPASPTAAPTRTMTPTAGPSPTSTKTPTPTFADVPFSHPYYAAIETLYQAGYTLGCNTDPLMYCPDATMNRAESAVFVERGIHSAAYDPPTPSSQNFADLPLDSWAAKWVNGLWVDQYTAGCGTNPLIYCPWQGHTRAEGCVFYLRMLNGASYEPAQPAQQTFADVPLDTWYAKWVQGAYDADLIPACQTTPELRFCPTDPLSRGLAAYMMVQAKALR